MPGGIERDAGGRTKLFRSFAVKLALLAGIFLAVPLVLYGQFKEADREQRRQLLDSVQRQGDLVAQGLSPLLGNFDGDAVPRIKLMLDRMAQPGVSIKLLLRPAEGSGSRGFFYIASVPTVPVEYLERERAELTETGVLDRLPDTCDGGQPLAVEYTNPAGKLEVLTSLTPISAPVGCWVVITSHAADGSVGGSLNRPYWQSYEVRLAAGIYVLMAVIVLWLFLGIWRNLRRFADLARAIRTDPKAEGSFVTLNRVPELESVADEFDHLVHGLRSTADLMRQTAEENAHAFKTPIAIISQSVEPLKKLVGEEKRGRRAITLIERSVEKLDALVSASRRMDESAAELLTPPREPVELASVVEGVVADYRESAAAGGLSVGLDLRARPRVRASAEILETVLENLLDNAMSFAPGESTVEVSLVEEGGRVRLAVADRGPGVDDADLERIFERYFSRRPTPRDPASDGPANFGIGLWIVRRNVEAVDGAVYAVNRSGGGLVITVDLPVAR